MAVLEVNKLWTSRGGSLDFKQHRTYREQWEVRVTATTDDEVVVFGAAGLPRIGTKHTRDPFAVAVKISPEQSEETPYIWYVGVEYDSQPDLQFSTDPDGTAQDPAAIPENPLKRPATWKISGQKTSEVADQWLEVTQFGPFGIPALGAIAPNFTQITTSAKLPFDPPVMAEVSRPVIRITKNVPMVTLAYLIQLQDAVNDRPWKGLPMWTARVDNYDATNKLENGIAYVELSLDICLKAETWVTKILDCGMMELQRLSRDPVTGVQKLKWTKIKDPFGQVADSPQPLDGNGGRLAPGAEPVYRRGLIRNYKLANFATLLPF